MVVQRKRGRTAHRTPGACSQLVRPEPDLRPALGLCLDAHSDMSNRDAPYLYADDVARCVTGPTTRSMSVM